MNFSRFIRLPVSIFMSVLLSNVTLLAASESRLTQNTELAMISTETAMIELSRSEKETAIQSYIAKPQVQAELQKQGVSNDEIAQRLATLTDNELNQLSLQIDQARYGGDILFTILIVVLIIYIVKRI